MKAAAAAFFDQMLIDNRRDDYIMPFDDQVASRVVNSRTFTGQTNISHSSFF